MAQLDTSHLPAPSLQAVKKEAAKTPVLERDDLYYLTSDFRSFKVENCLFRIPTYRLLDESKVFGAMFELIESLQENTPGVDLEMPIELPSTVSKDDFRNFLKALYPRKASISLVLEQTEWISVLRLSTLWFFLELRAIAMVELEKTLTPSDKIFYGREFRISSWFGAGLKALITRTETISKASAVKIDYETTFSLFRLREQHYRICASSSAQNTIFKEEFGVELDKIESDQAELEGRDCKKGGPA